jgi:ISXO2-like transposase domain/Transposase zinc-ribbon domain
VEYPKNLREFDRLFAPPEACLSFLEKVRWGDGFRCLACGGKSFWTLATGLRRCRSCRFKNSVKSGTIFESSRLPLKMWFYSIWWITAQKSGVSALDLQKDVGLGSYRSAWMLLHKIRIAMSRADKNLLQGEVEVDVIEVKGEPLLVAAECVGRKNVGRVRLEKLRSGAPAAWETFLAKNISRGSVVRTNGLKYFGDLSRLGFKHAIFQPRSPKRSRRARALPRVQMAAEQLRKWLLGTLRGRVEAKHLANYLEEFVFRFNCRASNARGQLFQRVMEAAVRIEPASYRKIIGRVGSSAGPAS